MTTKNLIAVLASLLILTTSNLITAAEPGGQQDKITDPAIFAQVNGRDLSRDMLDFLLQSREKDSSDEGEMQVDDPQRQSSLQDKTAKDLIMTVLLAQQATASNMHKSARFKMELELFQQTLLAQLFVQQIMDDVEIEESLIRKRYEQQPEQVLYRFMIWETPDAALATTTLESLTNSDLPPSVNPQVTTIETPWLMGSGIDPQVQQTVINLSLNEFVDTPIYQDEVWKVVQLIDKKAFAKQSYELERDIIRAEMVAEKLQETLDTLMAQATIRVNAAYSADVIAR